MARRGWVFGARYRELLAHYELRGSQNEPGRARQNGSHGSRRAVGGNRGCGYGAAAEFMAGSLPGILKRVRAERIAARGGPKCGGPRAFCYPDGLVGQRG